MSPIHDGSSSTNHYFFSLSQTELNFELNIFITSCQHRISCECIVCALSNCQPTLLMGTASQDTIVTNFALVVKFICWLALAHLKIHPPHLHLCNLP